MAMVVRCGSILVVMLLGTFFSYSDCQLEAFTELQKVDDEISASFALLINTVKKQKEGADEIQKKVIDNIALHGSIVEGSTTAAVFKPNKKAEDGLNRELKTGFTYNVIDIPEKYKNLVEDVTGKEGFTQLRANTDTLRFLDSLQLKVDPKEFQDFLPHVMKDGYLKPYRLREKVLEKVETLIEGFASYDGIIELFLAAALNEKLDSIKLKLPHLKLSQLPTSSSVDLIVDKKAKLKISWTVGTVIKLNWWPEVAQEWVGRKREWPSKEKITSLTDSSYITTMASDEVKDKDSLELVYSFAHVERALVAERSPKQALIYLVFRSMLYRWIRPTGPARIHSRISKTIMLWVCEEYPPNHSLWSDPSAVSQLTALFSKLLEALESKSMPHYFIPAINVLDNIDEEVRVREITQIKRMLSDMNEYVPDNVKEVTAVSREILEMIKSTQKLVNDLVNENYDIFLTRTDLVPKALEIFGLSFLGFGGKKEKEKVKKTISDVKDTISEKWSEFQNDFNMDDVTEKVKKVADNFDLSDLEKKAKEYLKKWEL